MSDEVNLLDAFAGGFKRPLELVRLDANEKAIVPFTAKGKGATLHYCGEQEIRGYVHCNGSDCILCRIGRKKDERVLLPVYVPSIDAVGVLSVSNSLRPKSLRPQLLPILKSSETAGDLRVVFISREESVYHVSTRALPEDEQGDKVAIREFEADYDAGRVTLESVFVTISNENLLHVTEIARIASLKGLAK